MFLQQLYLFCSLKTRKMNCFILFMIFLISDVFSQKSEAAASVPSSPHNKHFSSDIQSSNSIVYCVASQFPICPGLACVCVLFFIFSFECLLFK